MRTHFQLSGETPQFLLLQGTPDQEIRVSELAALNVEKREYQKSYMEYWNSTVDITGTGRPVDGLICPTAVHPAPAPNKYNYGAMFTGLANVLDYTSVVIPVTHANKTIDVPLSADKALNEKDRKSQEECKLE